MRVDRQKLRKNCEFTCPRATLSHEMRVDRQKLRKNCDFYLSWSNPFARNEGRSAKNCGKIAILLVLEQPFRTKWGSIGENWGKIAILLVPEQLFHTKMRVDRRKTEVKLRFYLSPSNPFARNEGRSSKSEEKLRFYVSVCKSVCV